MGHRLILRTARHFIFIAITAFFLAASFGISHAGMNTDAQGHMTDCPFMGMTALCEMSPFQHIAAWQGMFAQLVHKDTLTVLVFLLLSFALSSRASVDRIPIPRTIHVRQFFDVDILVFSNPLKEAFARGIIHPKVF